MLRSPDPALAALLTVPSVAPLVVTADEKLLKADSRLSNMLAQPAIFGTRAVNSDLAFSAGDLSFSFFWEADGRGS